MRKILRQLTINLIWGVYSIFKPLFRKPTLSVLMYHSVDDNDWEFSLTPENFEKQISFLIKNQYSFIELEDIPDFLNGSKKLIGKNILITFDDGYHDFYENALPVLRKFKAPAVLFIHTSRLSDNLGNNYKLLDWKTIQELQQYSINICSHSHTHPNLKELTLEELKRDIEFSDQELRRYVETNKFIAYPGGKYSRDVIKLLSDLGYKAAFTINRGLVKQGDNSLELKRNGIQRNTSFTEFKMRTTLANSWYERLKI